MVEAVLDETPRELALPAASVPRPFPPSVVADDLLWLLAVDAVGCHGASPGSPGQSPLRKLRVVYGTRSRSVRDLRARRNGHLDQLLHHRDHHLCRNVAVCWTGRSRSW